MSPILDRLRAEADPVRAAQMAAYHKAPRTYLGVGNGRIDDILRETRPAMDLPARLAEARALWDSDIHEARIAAAKLLTQARIRPDDTAVWEEICRWVPGFDAWAIADHACAAGGRRLTADPSRLDEVEPWTRDDSFWVRRAALVITLPWTRQRHPSDDERQARERILGWAAGMVEDRQWFIQKAVAWWLRDLSRRDPDRVRTFLAVHGGTMKAFARREASKYLPPEQEPGTPPR